MILDEFLADKRMRSARLSESDSSQLIECFVVLRMDRQKHVRSGFLCNIVEALDGSDPGSHGGGHIGEIRDSVIRHLGPSASEDVSEVALVSVFKWDQSRQRAWCWSGCQIER